MKAILYLFSLLCAVMCGLNIWCLATDQPSTLHLNGIAALVDGLVSIICLISGMRA